MDIVGGKVASMAEDTGQSVAAPFEQEVAGVLQRLRTAFAELVGALPGGVAKPADLQRALKLDMKLCWKIFKVLGATDPLAAGPHVPGTANMRAFLKAVGRSGVSAGLIESAAQAAADFEDLVTTHAGDRSAFDSMTSGLAGEEAGGQIHLQHKRAAFRANRHIWGAQAKTLLRALVVQPATDPTLLSLAVLHGYFDLRRLRSDAPLVVSRERLSDNDGTLRKVDREALDPEGQTPHGFALLREFCSQPLATFRTVDAEAGFVHGELVTNGVGNRAAVTFVHGHVIDAAGPRFRDERNDFFRMSVLVRIPCEVLVFDLLVREDTFVPCTPEAHVYGEHLGEGPYPSRPQERDILPLHESVVYLGKGASVLHTPHVPRYMEMARDVFKRLNWDAGRFDVYRCHVQYPVLGATVRVALKMPEGPGE
jgi:hypothetical protein